MHYNYSVQKIYFPNFNPDLTLLGGQAFNWIKDGEFYSGVFSDRVLKVKYEGEYLHWESSLGEKDIDFVKELFDMELDYEGLLCEITKDESVKKAVAEFPGLRILKQPFEQTLISFVISQNSNIPKIKNSLTKLSKLAGRKTTFDNKEFHLFPTLPEISNLKFEALVSTGIGYRAKYIERICRELNDKKLPTMEKSLKKYREFLIDLHGIGPKVADCILVFGLGFREITPIDLWARRAFVKTYNLDPKINYEDLMVFIQSKFGNNSAYAGQFLFEYFRIKSIK